MLSNFVRVPVVIVKASSTLSGCGFQRELLIWQPVTSLVFLKMTGFLLQIIYLDFTEPKVWHCNGDFDEHTLVGNLSQSH